MMLLQPKRYKFKKTKKGRLKKKSSKTNRLLLNGEAFLVATESGSISSKQIETARQAMSRKIKKTQGKLWIKIFPDLPVTKKPNEARMGKGKGSLKYWVKKVSSGTVLFEVCGKDNELFESALKTGKAKLPIDSRIFFNNTNNYKSLSVFDKDY